MNNLESQHPPVKTRLVVMRRRKWMAKVQTLVLLVVGIGLAINGRAQSFLTNGLVAYYPFNGNANDVVGTNHGAVVGATLTTNRLGSADSAYSFNGPNYIQCPDTGLPSGNAPRTVCLWINVASFMGTITYPFGYGVNTPASAFYATVNSLYYSVPTIGLGMANNVDTPRWGEAKINVWYHLAITYSNSTATLFINGVNVGEAPRSFGTIMTGSFFIGGNMDAAISTVNFTGRISDVRIYNRALSNSEVQQLYAFESNPCTTPRTATGTATVVNGFVVGVNITDPGCGYTNAPLVLITGGGGTGATASATISGGSVTGITVTSAGIGYTNTPSVQIASPPFMPWLGISVSRVMVTQHVVLGRNYVLESSNDLVNWTPTGPPFTAQAEVIATEFVVEQTGRFFRIRQVP